jgi:hypothetical protein
MYGCHGKALSALSTGIAKVVLIVLAIVLGGFIGLALLVDHRDEGRHVTDGRSHRAVSTAVAGSAARAGTTRTPSFRVIRQGGVVQASAHHALASRAGR